MASRDGGPDDSPDPPGLVPLAGEQPAREARADSGEADRVHERAENAATEPSEFDRKLEKTDATIKLFAIVSGAAAVISAVVAFYTATTLNGTSKQTSDAINQMATFADAEIRQANAMSTQVGLVGNQLSEMQEQTGILGNQAASAQASAEAATRHCACALWRSSRQESAFPEPPGAGASTLRD